MRYRQERGAIALLTLAFLVTIGAAVLVFLWGTARVTGAFNALYAANQAAAYASVTSARTTVSAAEIRCNSFRTLGSDVCYTPFGPVGARDALYTAELTLAEAFPPGQKETNFGLCYAPSWDSFRCGSASINLSADGGVGRSIRVINISPPANSTQAQARRTLCQSAILGFSGTGVRVVSEGVSGSDTKACWFLREYGNAYGINYNSGVATKSTAEIEYFPGCSASICPKARIEVYGAAAQDQPTPEAGY